MIGPTRRFRHCLLVLLCAHLLVPGAAAAQTATPSPRAPTLDGEVTGGQIAGEKLSLSVDATMPTGWQDLHLVETELLVEGGVVESVRYDIENVTVTVGGQKISAGTGGEARGAYLSIPGSGVIVTTGGAHLSLILRADVVRDVPEGARFRMSVTSDRGQRVAVTRGFAEPESAGLTWTTLLTGVLVALLIGGFVGNTFASRRRPPPRLSVYASIQRRIDEERSPVPQDR